MTAASGYTLTVVVCMSIRRPFTNLAVTQDRVVSRDLHIYVLEYSGIGYLDKIVNSTGTGGVIEAAAASVACADGVHVVGVIVDCAGATMPGFTDRTTYDGDLVVDRNIAQAGNYSISGTTTCVGWSVMGLYFAVPPCVQPPAQTVTVSGSTLAFSTSATILGNLVISSDAQLAATTATIVVTGNVTLMGGLTVSNTATVIVQG